MKQDGRKISNIAESYEELEKSINALKEAINLLVERLVPVTLSYPRDESKNNEKPQVDRDRCDIDRNIADATNEIISINLRLQQLYNDLQI